MHLKAAEKHTPNTNKGDGDQGKDYEEVKYNGDIPLTVIIFKNLNAKFLFLAKTGYKNAKHISRNSYDDLNDEYLLISGFGDDLNIAVEGESDVYVDILAISEVDSDQTFEFISNAISAQDYFILFQRDASGVTNDDDYYNKEGNQGKGAYDENKAIIPGTPLTLDITYAAYRGEEEGE
ncbi:MAG: hypothetical protein EZS28_000937 [Streblomastix strix]|uniref:Uncharacterized protein n=1 Tax=Streblomastix strix TaxID=222440 RepID=A0A5J4X8G7_9EUKA|nr:MAG: hypothetical protein EZS28_000937 [Streblomastix strix]